MRALSRRARPIARASVRVALAATLQAGFGCGSVQTSNTPRTGTEQLLLTNAYDTALGQVDFRPLTGVPIFLDTAHVTAIDQGWVISGLRQAMLSQGVLLRAKPEQAQWIVEARVGAYGTDSDNLLVGIPQTTVPNVVPLVPSGTIPEVPLIKRTRQQGVAKLALFAYDRASGQMVWNSGTMLASSNSKDVHILGAGPFHSDSMREGTEFVGMRLPLSPQGSTEAKAKAKPKGGRGGPADATPNAPSPGSTDYDAFIP